MLRLIFLRLKYIRYYLRHLFISKFVKGVYLGEKVRIDSRSHLVARNGGKIFIANNVYLRSNSKGYHSGMPFPTTLLADGNSSLIKIGDNCRINGAYIHSQKSIEIGCNCVIAAGVNILDSNGHVVHSGNRTTGRDEPKNIIIGDNVWLGVNSIILKDSRIGNNCVVSACSVVKGYFPDNSIIQGNPATIVGNVNC